MEAKILGQTSRQAEQPKTPTAIPALPENASLTTNTEKSVNTSEHSSGVRVKRLPERPRGLIQGN